MMEITDSFILHQDISETQCLAGDSSHRRVNLDSCCLLTDQLISDCVSSASRSLDSNKHTELSCVSADLPPLSQIFVSAVLFSLTHPTLRFNIPSVQSHLLSPSTTCFLTLQRMCLLFFLRSSAPPRSLFLYSLALGLSPPQVD